MSRASVADDEAVAEAGKLLAAGAAKLGLVLQAEQRRALLALLDELADWNTRVNLTAIRGRGEMVVKHLLDSLSLQPWLGGKRIADVGTGAGFPGLPLAIVNPARRFVLVEATGKKVRFVEHAIGLLGLDNVEVVHARAESFHPQRGFDVVTCRAFGSLADFLRMAGHLCAPGGRMLAMKGRDPQAELAALPRGWQVKGVHRLTVPGLDAERHLVELGRRGAAGMS